MLACKRSNKKKISTIDKFEFGMPIKWSKGALNKLFKIKVGAFFFYCFIIMCLPIFMNMFLTGTLPIWLESNPIVTMGFLVGMASLIFFMTSGFIRCIFKDVSVWRKSGLRYGFLITLLATPAAVFSLMTFTSTGTRSTIIDYLNFVPYVVHLVDGAILAGGAGVGSLIGNFTFDTC